jgi:hypothetical protein
VQVRAPGTLRWGLIGGYDTQFLSPSIFDVQELGPLQGERRRGRGKARLTDEGEVRIASFSYFQLFHSYSTHPLLVFF